MASIPSKRVAPHQALAEGKMKRQSPPRSTALCDECRVSKKKCSPKNRNWEERGERCDNCVKGNKACGPNKKSGKFGPPTAADASTNNANNIPSNVRLLHNPTLLPKVLPRPDGNHSSFEAPLQDLDHDGVRTQQVSKGSGSLSFQTGGLPAREGYEPATTSSWPDVESRLELLRPKLDDIYPLLHDMISRWHTTLDILPCPSTPTFESQAFESNLYNCINNLCTQFQGALDEQLTLLTFLRPEDTARRELWLRRLANRVRPLYDISTLGLGRLQGRSESLPKCLLKVYTRILQELAAVCTGGDADIVLSDLHRLPSSPPCLKSQSALRQTFQASFERQSHSMKRAWTEIAEPHDTRRLGPFHCAARFDAEHLILLSTLPESTKSSFLNSKIDGGKIDHLGRGSLHRAVEAGNVNLVQHVYAARPESLHDHDILGMTPLLLAAALGCKEVFALLYEGDGSKRVLDRFNRDVLIIASRMGHDSIVRYLLQKQHHVGQSYSDPQYSPLFVASSRGHYSTVQLLLTFNFDPSHMSGGKTPREMAECIHRNDIVNLLKANAPPAGNLRQPVFARTASALPTQSHSPPSVSLGRKAQPMTISTSDDSDSRLPADDNLGTSQLPDNGDRGLHSAAEGHLGSHQMQPDHAFSLSPSDPDSIPRMLSSPFYDDAPTSLPFPAAASDDGNSTYDFDPFTYLEHGQQA